MSWPAMVNAKKKPLSWLGMKPLGMMREQPHRAHQHARTATRQCHEPEAQHDQQRAVVGARHPVEAALRAPGTSRPCRAA